MIFFIYSETSYVNYSLKFLYLVINSFFFVVENAVFIHMSTCDSYVAQSKSVEIIVLRTNLT